MVQGLTVGLALVLAQASAPSQRPEPIDSVRLFFLAGDLSKAQQLARGCARKGSRPCKTMVKLLARYAELARRPDDLGANEARALLELDHEVSPAAKGKLTEKVVVRFVTAPLELARHHAAQGNPESARVIARQVLGVDPSNLEAQRLASSP